MCKLYLEKYVYIYIYLHICKDNKKEGFGFEKEQGKEYMIGFAERIGRNDIIIL